MTTLLIKVYSYTVLSSDLSKDIQSLVQSSAVELNSQSSKNHSGLIKQMAAHIAVLFLTGYVFYIAEPGSSLFSWHPVLMTLAFVVAVFEAVLVFSPQSSLLGSVSHQTKVTIHGMLAGLGAACAIGGFAIIFQVKENNKKLHFQTWHGLLGLITVGYACMQLLGGACVKYYPYVSGLLKMKLADLKTTHATSGTIAFGLITATLLTALNTTWFVEKVGEGVAWYACALTVIFIGLAVGGQVLSSYGHVFKRIARGATPSSKK